MMIIAQPFPRATQARQAMLDLVTSGVPRPDIGILLSRPPGGQPPVDSRDVRDVGDDQAYASIAGLDNAITHTLAGGGVVTAIGPMAETLASSAGEAAEDLYCAAMLAMGASDDQARDLARQLSPGGALVAVRIDPVRETVVRGVFHHAMTPALNGPGEPEGPEDGREAAGARGEPPSASVGALTGGAIAGGWGNAGLDLEGLGDDSLTKAR